MRQEETQVWKKNRDNNALDIDMGLIPLHS